MGPPTALIRSSGRVGHDKKARQAAGFREGGLRRAERLANGLLLRAEQFGQLVERQAGLLIQPPGQAAQVQLVFG